MSPAIYSRLIGFSILLVGLMIAAAPVSAKRQKYVDPEAKSVGRACKKIYSVDERETCVREMIDNLALGPADTRLIWEKLLVEHIKPLTAKIKDHKELPLKDGPTVIIGDIKDRRVFEFFIGNNRLQDLSSETLGDVSTDKNGLIGRFFDVRKEYPEKYITSEVRLKKDKTVSIVIREAVTGGLEQAGYRVIDSGVEDSAGATRIDVEIYRFWIWNQDSGSGWGGYGDNDFIGEIDLEIRSDLPAFRELSAVKGRARLRGSSPRANRSWTNTGNVTVKNLSDNVRLAFEEKTIEVSEPGASPVSPDVFEKAKKCQDKGGVWINDTCQIQID